MRRLGPRPMSKRFRQGAELPNTYVICVAMETRKDLGEGAKMVPGTEGRGPEFLYVRMHEKMASFLKRF